MMGTKLALVLGALSAAAILGTGVNFSAEDASDCDAILASAQWSEIIAAAEVCYANGLDNDQIADVIASYLDESLGDELSSRGIADDDIQDMFDLIGAIAAQRVDIDECLAEIQLEGLKPHEIRGIIHPMMECYSDMMTQLSNSLARYGLI